MGVTSIMSSIVYKIEMGKILKQCDRGFLCTCHQIIYGETHSLCIWLGGSRQSPSAVDTSVNSSVKRITSAFGLGVQAITVGGWFSKVCCCFFNPGCHGRHSPQRCSTQATCLVVVYINGPQKSESNCLFSFSPTLFPLGLNFCHFPEQYQIILCFWFHLQRLLLTSPQLCSNLF